MLEFRTLAVINRPTSFKQPFRGAADGRLGQKVGLLFFRGFSSFRRRYFGADLLTDWLFMALGDQVEREFEL